MERLQSAINRARSQRSFAPAGAATAATPAVATFGDVWNSIPAFAPSPEVLERNRVLTLNGGSDSVPFDMMRTKVLQQMNANNWRRVAITSPTAGVGKTTLAVNLAFALARQSEIRTAVIELDLRKPALSKTIGFDEVELQFSQVLEGRQSYAAHMRRVGENLVFGAGTRSVSQPAELLQSETTAKVLTQIEKELELSVMLFDMPPMLVGDDVLTFVGQADCALLVAAAESTTIAEIDRCERDLAERTNVLGVVLNKCRYTGKDYGYDY